MRRAHCSRRLLYVYSCTVHVHVYNCSVNLCTRSVRVVVVCTKVFYSIFEARYLRIIFENNSVILYTCTCTRTRTCTVQLGRATLFMFIYTHVLYTCTVYRCTRTCTVHVHVRVKDVYHMILPYSIINNCTFVDNMICTTYFRTFESTYVKVRLYKFVESTNL